MTQLSHRFPNGGRHLLGRRTALARTWMATLLLIVAMATFVIWLLWSPLAAPSREHTAPAVIVLNPPEYCALVGAEFHEVGAEVRYRQYQGAAFAWDLPAYGVTRVSGLPRTGSAKRAPVPHLSAQEKMSAAACGDTLSVMLAERLVPSSVGGVP
jgi:hypothetical protein